jgi:hypothetical protein
MNAITNFKDAKEALKSLAGLAQSVESFIVSMEQRIDAVYALKGSSIQADLPLPTTTNSHSVSEKPPESWRDRVLVILKRANRPLKQKDVVQAYEALNWPKNYADNLYATISSAMAYLYRTGKLVKADDGYKLPAEAMQVSVNRQNTSM